MGAYSREDLRLSFFLSFWLVDFVLGFSKLAGGYLVGFGFW